MKNVHKLFSKCVPICLKQIGKRISKWPEERKFEYKNDNIEGEMLRNELNWLYLTAKKMDSIVELGSWKGRSTHALLSGCKGTVYAIDHFKGSTNEEKNVKTAIENNIYQDFLKNVGHFKNLKVYRMDSAKAAENFEDNSIDMVFIDANHSYEAVKADIEAWLPKTKKLICGHDYTSSWPGVIQAVHEKFDNVHSIPNIWFKQLTNNNDKK